MGKPRVGFPNYTRDCTFETTSTPVSGFPVTSLAIHQPILQPFQVSGQTMIVRGKFVTPVGLGMLLCGPSNFLTTATFQLETWTEDDYATGADYDSGAGVDWYPTIYAGDAEWEYPEFVNGKYSDSELEDTAFWRPIILPAQNLIKSFQLTIEDSANPDDLWLGYCDVSYGAQLDRGPIEPSRGFNARTRSVESYGGGKFFERLNKARTFRGTLPAVTRSQAMSVAYELMRQHDLDRPFAWVADPNDSVNWLRESFLARFGELSPLQRLQSGKFENVPLNLEEAL